MVVGDSQNIPHLPLGEYWQQVLLTLRTENATLNNEVTLLENKNRILADKNKLLTNEIELLKEQLAVLKAKRFGKSSERLERQINELEYRIEEKEIEEELRCSIYEKDKKQPKRLPLPEYLPRTEVLIAAPEVCDECGGQSFRKIADDISEILEYVPSSFKVIRHIRPRCACIGCEKIVQGYAPGNTIDKGKAGPGLLAHIMIQKYCNHLPMYRQSQIYEREGIQIPRSTMVGWAAGCSRLLEPLISEFKKYVFSSSQIHGDDTPVKVLAPGNGKTKLGRLWTYVRDGRPFGEEAAPAVCYFYSPDRKGIRPLDHLKDFTGVLHADAYGGYDNVYGDNIEESACWSHSRRNFYDVLLVNDKAAIANYALEEIGKIYDIEREVRGLGPAERIKARQERAKIIVDELFINLKKSYNKLPRKSSTARAIAYMVNNEVALKRFLDNGKIEIDNNAAERAMRSIALGRKNWMFAGSDNGGNTAANFYTLIETAKLNNINPWKYLSQVLAVIQDYNSTKIADLLPWNIKLE